MAVGVWYVVVVSVILRQRCCVDNLLWSQTLLKQYIYHPPMSEVSSNPPPIVVECVLLFLFDRIFQLESSLKPLWLNNVHCISSSKRNLALCSRDNLVGFADCSLRNIAAVDCGSSKFFVVYFNVLVCQQDHE